MVNYPAAHDEAAVDPAPFQIVAAWPIGSFLENIVVLPDGDFIVSVHNQRELHRVSLTGERKVWASIPSPPAGLALFGDAIYTVAGEPGQGPHHLFKVGPAGAVEDLGAISGTLFLNGLTPGRPGCAYGVDSIAGAVFEIGLETTTSRVVIQDELLTKCSDEPMLPGANGVKMGDDGLYITNTDRALGFKSSV